MKKLLCLVVTGIMVAGCNSGNSSGGTPQNNAIMTKYTPNTGNTPDIGGSGWGFQPNTVKLAGNLSNGTSMQYTNMGNLVVTNKAIYSVQANLSNITGATSAGFPAYIVANTIDGSGALGAVLGSNQSIGNENLYPNDALRSTGNKIALSLNGNHLFVLADTNKQVALVGIKDDGSTFGIGSYPQNGFNSTPVSVSTLPNNNSDEVIVLGKNGELDTFLRKASILTNYSTNTLPSTKNISTHFVDMAVDNLNRVYTIDADNNMMWVWKFNGQGFNTPTSYSVGTIPVSVAAVQISNNTYAYVLNRGSIDTAGQATISIFNNTTKSISTYSDNYGQGLVAKQIKTDGKNIFVFFSNPNANSQGSHNRVISYSINPSDGSLTYIGTQKFGNNPFSYTSEFNQGVQTNLNKDLLYVTDENTSVSASNVIPFLHFNNQILEMSKYNVLYDCNSASSTCNTNNGSVIKMRRYSDDVSGNNYLFFLIKNNSGYKIKVLKISNTTNTSTFSPINISNTGVGNSYTLPSQFKNVYDIMLAGHSLYILGSDTNNNAYFSQYSIQSTSTTGISSISATAASSSGNLIPRKIAVNATINPRILWFTQNTNDYVYALINNSDLVSYEETATGLNFLADTTGEFANGTFAEAGHAIGDNLFYTRTGSGAAQNITKGYVVTNGIVQISNIYKTWANPCKLFSTGSATANVIGTFINSSPRSTNISAECSVLDAQGNTTYHIAAGGTGYNGGFTPSTDIVGDLNKWFVANNQRIAFSFDSNNNVVLYNNNDDAAEPYFSHSLSNTGTLQAAYANTTPQDLVLMPYTTVNNITSIPAIVILDTDGSLISYQVTSWNGDN